MTSDRIGTEWAHALTEEQEESLYPIGVMPEMTWIVECDLPDRFAVVHHVDLLQYA